MTHEFGEFRITASPTKVADCWRLDLMNASGDMLHAITYASNKKGPPEQWDAKQWDGLLDTMQQDRAARTQ